MRWQSDSDRGGVSHADRNTPEYDCDGADRSLLIEGDDSLLHQELVQKRGLTENVNGGSICLERTTTTGRMLSSLTWSTIPRRRGCNPGGDGRND